MHSQESPSIYYYANQVYQFSYALPIYRRASGKFLARDLKRYCQFRKHLLHFGRNANNGATSTTPKILFIRRKKFNDLNGVIIFFSNAASIIQQDISAKTIFVGHGTGDKPYMVTKSRLDEFDFHFASGPKYLEILKDSKIDVPQEKIVKIGNLRFDAYLNGDIDKSSELDRLGVVDRERKTVLYAPTWEWGDGTLLKYGYRFAQEITKKYNLIIRPHYKDAKHIRKFRKWAASSGISHLYFSNPSNLASSDTMHDFAVSDIMISDTSSVLYEYLVTRRPIIVVKNNYKELHKMPAEMDVMQHVPIFSGEEDIMKMIDAALEDEVLHKNLENLLSACFYFNDGKAVDRASNFIQLLK